MAIEVPITFYYSPYERLHVGYRGRDSALVWMERDEGESDEDGDGKKNKKKDDFGFIFTIDEEDPHWEGPREAEIYWLPHFCPSWHEAKEPSAKKSMQRETLTNAFRYLSEKDPAAVGGLEQELHSPGFSRWSKWFESAKKWKRNKLQKVKSQVAAAVAGGFSEKRARDQANYDDTDQGYESDDGDLVPPATPRNMGPPARPSAGGKRRAPGGDGNGNENYRGAKKSRQTRNGAGQHYLSAFMSGVRGSSHRSTRNSRAGSPNDDLDSDYGDNISDIYDTRAPEGRSPTRLNGYHPTGFTPPPTGQRSLKNMRSVHGGRNVNGNEDTFDRTRSYNGQHLSEADAVQEAMRASMQPEETNNRDLRESIGPGGFSEEEAIQRAVRASRKPEAGPDDRVVPSIERDENGTSEH
jgi:hypothetical protein